MLAFFNRCHPLRLQLLLLLLLLLLLCNSAAATATATAMAVLQDLRTILDNFENEAGRIFRALMLGSPAR